MVRPDTAHRTPRASPARRHAVPCATITHTLPRRLHSMHTLEDEIAGRRSFRSALITSSSCILLMGQPWSSKST